MPDFLLIFHHGNAQLITHKSKSQYKVPPFSVLAPGASNRDRTVHPSELIYLPLDKMAAIFGRRQFEMNFLEWKW